MIVYVADMAGATCVAALLLLVSCGPSLGASTYYDVSLLGSGEQLVYDSNPSLTYKPLFFKPKSTVGTTPIEVEKVYFIPSWWLNVKRINGKAQCIHVGKNSQLFMGDCDREEFEAILLLFDEITTKKIFNMAKPNEGLVKMGPNGEAQMLNGQETKFVLTEVQ